MSKNIYRINKKTDLDDLMMKNFYKPICVIFITKNKDISIYNDLCSTLLALSKVNTYSITIIIDFDNFTDNFNNDVGYFDFIKNKTPCFIAFFKGKIIGSCDNSTTFIPILINHMEQIHKSYLEKLIKTFDISNTENNIQENVKENVKENVEENKEETTSKSSISKTSDKKRSNKKQEKNEIDNTSESSNNSNDTEEIERKKEKLKKIKELRNKLNK